MVPGPRGREVTAADLPAITALHAAAAEVDGGSPLAAAGWLLSRWYLDHIDVSRAVFSGGELIGVCARRFPGRPDGSPWKIAGLVGPRHRGQGLGGRLLDFALEGTGTSAPVQVETESLTPSADALYRSRGLHPVFAEDVMSMPLAAWRPVVPAGTDVTFTEWNSRVAPRFFAVWEAAFRERPGFPGWPAGTWISWIADHEAFRADWTLLASGGGVDVGFIAGAAGGWIVQLGVIPAARGRRISALMINEVCGRMIAAGEARAVLTVNSNNPSAIAIYERIGFARTGRRARYERDHSFGRSPRAGESHRSRRRSPSRSAAHGADRPGPQEGGPIGRSGPDRTELPSLMLAGRNRPSSSSAAAGTSGPVTGRIKEGSAVPGRSRSRWPRPGRWPA